MPFFEKFKNQLPGVVVPDNATPLQLNTSRTVDTPSTATQQRPQVRDSSRSSASSFSLYSAGLPSRSGSVSTTASRKIPEKDRRPLTPTSESGSDYGGLAYADSTDYEDEDQPDDSKTSRGKTNPPPPLALTSSILRPTSTTSTNHVRFPSTSDRSERSAIRIPSSKGRHQRDTSLSSVSSADGDGESRRSNSAAVAHALGLSQTPPTSYGRLGGPGIGMGGRGGRSTSGSSSSGSRSAYSRGGSEIVTGATGLGKLEREMKTLLEDANATAPTEEPKRAGLSKSKSTSKQRTFGESGSGSESGARPVSAINGTKAHRSNTVQGPPAPEPKSPKLPTRARTSTERGSEVGKEKKVKKSRVCLKCQHKIEDGRWVQVDNGGVLCEKCWKNMYLPKVNPHDFFQERLIRILIFIVSSMYPAHRKTGRFVIRRSVERQISPRML